PSVNSSNVLIKASNASNTAINDVSNASFNINTTQLIDPVRYRGGAFDGYSMRSSAISSVTVTSPNTNVAWQANTTQSITWTSANIDNVLIEYTIDNGSNWTSIITTPAGSGAYSWLVPQVPGGSTQCAIRITDVLNPTVTDISDVN